MLKTNNKPKTHNAMKYAKYNGKRISCGVTSSRGRYVCTVELTHGTRTGYTTDAEVYDFLEAINKEGKLARRACYGVAMRGDK